MNDTKVLTTRKGEKKVVHVDGSMESERHRVHDAIAEINYDNKRRGKKEISSKNIVGNSKASKYIRVASGLTRWQEGQYERIFNGGT